MTNRNPSPVFIGNTQLQGSQQPVTGEYVSMLGEVFYKINHYDAMDPFFMSIVSSSNHWLFIASTGGLTAGRVSAEQSLFPYYTVDKLTENSENTGRKAILLITRKQRTSLWEPFSNCYQGIYQIERSIYKNIPGSVVVFEETNHSLGLTYRYAWRTSDRFGFVVTSWLKNVGDENCQIELLDGLQNILPANITVAAQNRLSTLLDAYKRSELDTATGLGIFSLNATITDLAEPSESLLATTVMQLGLDAQDYLLSSGQLGKFRTGKGLEPETEIRGQRCAYFVHAAFDLPTRSEANLAPGSGCEPGQHGDCSPIQPPQTGSPGTHPRP